MYHKWDVKNDITFVLHFFSLISNSLSGVAKDDEKTPKYMSKNSNLWTNLYLNINFPKWKLSVARWAKNKLL